jgi:hypothetical protein
MTATVLYRDREDKLEAMAAALAPQLSGSVLDVGCDRRALRRFVPGPYVGVDFGGDPDVVCDLEAGLPFEDRSFDAVVAMDVLEHLERAHFVLDECLRIADRHVIVGLPNMYEWHFRLRFALGRAPSGKYGLPAERTEDRHRWLLSLDEARRFVLARGSAAGFALEAEVLPYYRYRVAPARAVSEIGRRIAPRAAGLLAYGYWGALRRR